MIAIDTNILVRYIVRDDVVQADRAKRLMQDELSADAPGFVSLAVIVELAWVLGKVYKLRPEVLRAIVNELLLAPQVVVERSDIVENALALELPDLADAIIHTAGKAAACTKTVTFDRRFAREDGVELLTV